MAKAIEQIQVGGMPMTVGHFGLGTHGDGIGSVKQQVHDGDTIVVRALGNLSIRFLGIDTPEISFMLPGSDAFMPVANAAWTDFLTDPFAGEEGKAYKQSLSSSLLCHLDKRLGPHSAPNHAKHALAAQRTLEDEVARDLKEQGESKESFKFFLAFASEVTDRYGRLLAYLNRHQASGPRPLDYNARMLKTGFASPYFIWPISIHFGDRSRFRNRCLSRSPLRRWCKRSGPCAMRDNGHRKHGRTVGEYSRRPIHWCWRPSS